jgi:hypothetical protein
MALPSSGSLSLGQIGQELGQSLSNLSLRNLSSSVGFGTPDKVSEFYGYENRPAQDFMIMYAGVYLDDPCAGFPVDIYIDRNTGYYYYYIGGEYRLFQGEWVYFYQYEDYWSGMHVWEAHTFYLGVEKVRGWMDSPCSPWR